MKKIIFLIIVLALLVFSSKSHSQTTYVLVLAESYPQNIDRDKLNDKIVRFVISDLKEGDSLLVLSDDEKTIAEFRVPNQEGYASSNVKRKKFIKEFIDLKQWIKKIPLTPDGKPQFFREPQILKHISSNKIAEKDGNKVSVLLVGSALYSDEREPGFNMIDGWFPSDGHIRVDEKHSIYGTANKSDFLKNFSIHHLVSNRESDWVNELHRQRIARFWYLFIKSQGGNFATITDDLNTAIERFSKAIDEPREDFQFDNTVNKVEMLRIAREVVTLSELEPAFMSDKAQLATQAPAKHEGKLRIGIRWPCKNCDVDLYAKSGQAPKFLYFSNVRTDEGIYHKDFTSSPETVNGLEFIDFTRDVDLYDMNIKLNFFAGHSDNGVPGIVRAEFDGLVYEDKFFIQAPDGNKGSEDDKENWQTIDIKKLMRMN